jgi:hypothetical protein
MRIGIEVNGVLRNTLDKMTQTYQKFLIDKTDGIEQDGEFKYEMSLPIESLNLKEHFNFQNEEELYSFLYEEFPMEIFGHAQSAEYSTFNDLNEFYLKFRDEHELIIISDEIGKSKPSTLFFLSKFGCQFENIKFYSNYTIKSMWNEIDVLLTANPALLLNSPSDKFVVKFNTAYNKLSESPISIDSIKELETKLKEIIEC